MRTASLSCRASSLPFEVSVPENDSFAYRNFILNIQRLKFEKFGQHAVDIAIDGRQEASIPLEVKQIPGKARRMPTPEMEPNREGDRRAWPGETGRPERQTLPHE